MSRWPREMACSSLAHGHVFCSDRLQEPFTLTRRSARSRRRCQRSGPAPDAFTGTECRTESDRRSSADGSRVVSAAPQSRPPSTRPRMTPALRSMRNHVSGNNLVPNFPTTTFDSASTMTTKGGSVHPPSTDFKVSRASSTLSSVVTVSRTMSGCGASALANPAMDRHFLEVS